MMDALCIGAVAPPDDYVAGLFPSFPAALHRA
jgi:hypothetical protein